MANEFPAQQPAYMGEWVFNGGTSAPPAAQQIRLNNSVDKNATLIYVSNLTTNGIDATDILMGMVPGCTIHLENKTDSTKWDNYAITGNPVANSGYVQLTVSWLAGGGSLAQTNIMLSTIAVAVRPVGSTMTANVGTVTVTIKLGTNVLVPVSGLSMQASAGTSTFKLGQGVAVTMPCLTAYAGRVEVSGQLMTFEYFHAFEGLHLTSPGITIRQWYAGQALMGFAASTKPAANLIGKVSEYCFKVADSMIAFEAKQTAGVKSPAVPRPPLPAPAAPPQSAPVTVTEAQVAALRKKDAANAA